MLTLLCASSWLLLPLPSYAGHWTLTTSGTATTKSGSTSVQGTVGNSHYSPSVCNFGGPGSLSVTATLTWTPDSSTDTSQPPPTVDVLETGSASAGQWILQATGVSTSVDDGFGDSVTSAVAPVYGGQSSGKHLYHKTVSSGQTTVTLPTRSLSAYLSYATAVATNGASVGGSYTVQVDTRAVIISCPAVDGSQYRDPPLTGPVIANVRQSDGTLRGDTVAPLGSGSYSYSGFANGAWDSLNTNYHWNGSISNSADAALIPIQNFSDTYLYGSFVGKTDHIFLSVYDGLDSAKATVNYYMHFHYQYEPSSWPLDAGYPKKVMGPDPDAASFPTPPPTYPWQLATDQNGNALFPLIGPANSNAGWTFGGTITKGGHVDGGLGVGKNDVNVQFGGGYDWSKSTDQSIFINPTPALGQSQQTWAVCRPSVNRSKGHLDIYGVHGYTQTGVWYKDDIVTTDYNYFQPYASITVTPFTPAPGWNPPGYS